MTSDSIGWDTQKRMEILEEPVRQDSEEMTI